MTLESCVETEHIPAHEPAAHHDDADELSGFDHEIDQIHIPRGPHIFQEDPHSGLRICHRPRSLRAVRRDSP